MGLIFRILIGRVTYKNQDGLQSNAIIFRNFSVSRILGLLGSLTYSPVLKSPYVDSKRKSQKTSTIK